MQMEGKPKNHAGSPAWRFISRHWIFIYATVLWLFFTLTGNLNAYRLDWQSHYSLEGTYWLQLDWIAARHIASSTAIWGSLLFLPIAFIVTLLVLKKRNRADWWFYFMQSIPIIALFFVAGLTAFSSYTQVYHLDTATHSLERYHIAVVPQPFNLSPYNQQTGQAIAQVYKCNQDDRYCLKTASMMIPHPLIEVQCNSLYVQVNCYADFNTDHTYDERHADTPRNFDLGAWFVTDPVTGEPYLCISTLGGGFRYDYASLQAPTSAGVTDPNCTLTLNQ